MTHRQVAVFDLLLGNTATISHTAFYVHIHMQNIRPTLCNFFTMSALSSAFTLWSSKTVYLMFLVFYSVDATIERLVRGSLFRDIWSNLNSLNHRQIVFFLCSRFAELFFQLKVNSGNVISVGKLKFLEAISGLWG